MAPTKAQLEQRLAALKQQHEQLVANANAVSGAIQLCQELIAAFDTSVSEHDHDTPTPVQ